MKGKKRHLSLSTKLKIVEDYLSGAYIVAELADIYNVVPLTIYNWLKRKDELLEQSQKSSRIYLEISEGMDAFKVTSFMALSKTEQDGLVKDNRKLKKENSIKDDRIAYLESLLELRNFNEKDILKKKV